MTPRSTMQSLVQEYLDHRRRLGFGLVIEGSQLMAFARFADRSNHHGPLTSEIILAWAQGEATRPTPITWASRMKVIRPFAKYRAAIEAGTEVPDNYQFGCKRRRLTPHIYTDTEIGDLLAAARRLSPQGTLRPATYETFFGLIAATGLRLSEALHLSCSDVDLNNGRLTVRQTKFCKSRLVPLHQTTTDALAQYATVRQQYVPQVPDEPFFVSATGVGLVGRTVHGVFARIRAKLGWVARGSHPAPRIHDLRHTFICRRVMLWHEHGVDIDNAMLALSTYVGHTRVSDTYWYLTGVPELMAVAGQRFEQFAFISGEDSHD